MQIYLCGAARGEGNGYFLWFATLMEIIATFFPFYEYVSAYIKKEKLESTEIQLSSALLLFN
ncbi:hypothetical protein [Heyndrickxia acidicola]|uniref:hypothetical protein n=1 Tax=Heyndrickxia acidicola TaxID=209389 RepID=UPI0018DD2215|nr:hypothetical protein [Heyndrickxia acidicola]